MVKVPAENGNAIISNGDINNSITNSFIEKLLKNIELAKGDVPSSSNELSASFDHWIELLKKKSSQKGKIDLNALRDSNNETLLCFLIKNRTLWNLLSQEDRDLLVDKSDINYGYSGPLDKTKQRVLADNYLHIAARVQNKEAFVAICKKRVNLVGQRNEDGNNPCHEAAKSKILLPATKEFVRLLEEEASKKIEKAEKAKDWKKLRRLKEELKCNKKYIKDALCSKDCAFNKDKRTPLYYLDPTERKEIKQTAGIKDKLICNKDLHICLYIAGTMLSIAALCVSLYFLFLNSPTFALSSGVAMASGAFACLLFKACEEIYNLHNEEASVQNVIGITQVSEGVGVAV
ncbi:hypothetical protein [Wolbachia endosymbiont (group E) of Neria commutata]|uniref:hypothetical protein n=1 Tax=Wolbachia endosymbiont (group E) of Neria commutata TaxID=3066149 RepID=UPI0031334854